jgi:dCTP deaminase
MAETTSMISEPFEPAQVRQRETGGVSQKIISYGTVWLHRAPLNSRSSPIRSTGGRPEELRRKRLCRFLGRRLHHSMAASHWHAPSVLPDSAQCDDLSGQKSTYARCGIITSTSPRSSRVGGYVTLGSATPRHCRRNLRRRAAPGAVFFESDKDDVCETSYKEDRGGKYQGAGWRAAAQQERYGWKKTFAAAARSTCLINAEGFCWCGQQWDNKMFCAFAVGRPSAAKNRTAAREELGC